MSGPSHDGRRVGRWHSCVCVFGWRRKWLNLEWELLQEMDISSHGGRWNGILKLSPLTPHFMDGDSLARLPMCADWLMFPEVADITWYTCRNVKLGMPSCQGKIPAAPWNLWKNCIGCEWSQLWAFFGWQDLAPSYAHTVLVQSNASLVRYMYTSGQRMGMGCFHATPYFLVYPPLYTKITHCLSSWHCCFSLLCQCLSPWATTAAQRPNLCMEKCLYKVIVSWFCLATVASLTMNFSAIHVLCTHTHLKLVQVFLNSQTEHNMEMKRTSIDYSRWVMEDFESPYLQTLGSRLVDGSPYIRCTNRKYYLLYNTTCTWIC